MVQTSVRKTTTRLISAGLAAFVIAQSFSLAQATPAFAADAPAADLKLSVSSAILMDAATGQVLYDMNSDAVLPPASMAKMMTEYLVFENLKSGKIKLEDSITVSEYSSWLTKGGGNSGIAKAVGEQFTVKDMVNAMAIYSDNGAAVSLAEKIAGSEESFVQMMNEAAKKMGLSDGAHFIDTTGLDRSDLGQYAPKSIEGETMFSAKDSALIAFHMLHDHPEILDYSKVPSLKFRPTDKEPMINWDYMLESNASITNFKKYAYQGLDGLKTGHTDKAGYCFTGTAQRGNMRLISVVMNAKTRDASFMETRKLLDYGFTNFETKTLLPAGSSVDDLPTVKVSKGVKTNIPVETEKDFSLIVKKGDTTAPTKVSTALEEDKLVAPIKKGQVLGKTTLTYNGKNYEVNLVAKEDVKKAGWFKLFFRSIRSFFANLF